MIITYNSRKDFLLCYKKVLGRCIRFEMLLPCVFLFSFLLHVMLAKYYQELAVWYLLDSRNNECMRLEVK